jgi:hypothetical protein
VSEAALRRLFADADLMAVVQKLAGQPEPFTPGVVYRHYDRVGVLLYIGSSDDRSIEVREQAHARTSRWWKYVDTITKEATPDRQSALRVERAAIAAERPIFNRSKRSPERDAREAAYIRSREESREDAAMPDDPNAAALVGQQLELLLLAPCPT